MLEYLKLTNIKKHRALTLNFVDGINILVGATESGKTSAMKGLLWALTNASTGGRLIHHGESSCEVEVGLDGKVITRSWSKSSNVYKLGEKELTAFKTDVPTEIKALVNISDINIQRRRDVPFMVYAKDTDNAEMFSQMLDLDEINTVITNSNAFVKDDKKEKTEAEAEASGLEKSLADYVSIDEAKESLDKILVSVGKLGIRKAEISNLKKLLDDYISNKNRLQHWKGITEGIEALQAISVQTDELSELSGEIPELWELHKKCGDLMHIVAYYKEAIPALTELDALNLEADKVSKSKVSIRENKCLVSRFADAEDTANLYSQAKEANESLHLLVVAVVKCEDFKVATEKLEAMKRAYIECKTSVDKKVELLAVCE
ncbi:hypothetical protein EOM86_04960, partial [Candidatus Nomurabacteria bacterium]|nr:hypothetical protein [Candidatus Nomurabacteria bacterium]